MLKKNIKSVPEFRKVNDFKLRQLFYNLANAEKLNGKEITFRHTKSHTTCLSRDTYGNAAADFFAQC